MVTDRRRLLAGGAGTLAALAFNGCQSSGAQTTSRGRRAARQRDRSLQGSLRQNGRGRRDEGGRWPPHVDRGHLRAGIPRGIGPATGAGDLPHSSRPVLPAAERVARQAWRCEPLSEPGVRGLGRGQWAQRGGGNRGFQVEGRAGHAQQGLPRQSLSPSRREGFSGQDGRLGGDPGSVQGGADGRPGCQARPRWRRRRCRAEGNRRVGCSARRHAHRSPSCVPHRQCHRDRGCPEDGPYHLLRQLHCGQAKLPVVLERYRQGGRCGPERRSGGARVRLCWTIPSGSSRPMSITACLFWAAT